MTAKDLQIYADVLLESYKRRAEMTYDQDDVSDILLRLYGSIMDRPFSGTHKEQERIALVATLELKRLYDEKLKVGD